MRQRLGINPPTLIHHDLRKLGLAASSVTLITDFFPQGDHLLFCLVRLIELILQAEDLSHAAQRKSQAALIAGFALELYCFLGFAFRGIQISLLEQNQAPVSICGRCAAFIAEFSKRRKRLLIRLRSSGKITHFFEEITESQ